jgi:hypothetical protein
MEKELIIRKIEEKPVTIDLDSSDYIKKTIEAVNLIKKTNIPLVNAYDYEDQMNLFNASAESIQRMSDVYSVKIFGLTNRQHFSLLKNLDKEDKDNKIIIKEIDNLNNDTQNYTKQNLDIQNSYITDATYCPPKKIFDIIKYYKENTFQLNSDNSIYFFLYYIKFKKDINGINNNNFFISFPFQPEIGYFYLINGHSGSGIYYTNLLNLKNIYKSYLFSVNNKDEFKTSDNLTFDIFELLLKTIQKNSDFYKKIEAYKLNKVKNKEQYKDNTKNNNSFVAPCFISNILKEVLSHDKELVEKFENEFIDFDTLLLILLNEKDNITFIEEDLNDEDFSDTVFSLIEKQKNFLKYFENTNDLGFDMIPKNIPYRTKTMEIKDE